MSINLETATQAAKAVVDAGAAGESVRVERLWETGVETPWVEAATQTAVSLRAMGYTVRQLWSNQV